MLKQKINRTIPGGALYYVIFVSFILLTVLLLFIMLRTIKSKSVRQELEYYQCIDNIDSALVLYLSRPDKYQKSDSVAIYLKDSAEVKVNRSAWGVYDKIIAKSFYREKQLNRTILAGIDPFSTDSIALWVPENEQSIYASGNSKVSGNARLPKKGIQRASIEGKPLNTDKLVSGSVENSNEEFLPIINRRLYEKISDMQDIDSLFSVAIPISSVSINDLDNTFAEYTRWFSSQKDIEINGFSTDQNIGIISTGSIVVEKDNEIDRCILSAERIRIKDGFKGSAQIIAQDSIIIGSSCKLEFPSAICVFSDDINNVYVELGEGCSFDGAIIVYQRKRAAEKPHLKVNQGAKIRGQVYHRGTVELYGDIQGSLWCEDFYLKTSRAYYRNHLLDNQVDFTSLPKNYVFVDLLKGYSNQVLDYVEVNY